MEWKEVRLGDVCSKIGSGATPSGGKEAYKGGDYHLIRSQNVLDFAFSKDGLASINDEQANKLKNVEIIQGDVLLNITGDSVARCCIVPSEILPARVNQHVAIIRPRKEELDNHYLLYYLQHYKRQLLQIASAGATRNAITKAMIENLILPCPKSLADQHRIASILSSLDRKIELNNKINADLEEMAQAIFKNWFVAFEPFKDGKFVDSELGMIPEGWKVGSLGDFCNVFTGKKNTNQAIEKGLYPFFSCAPEPLASNDAIFNGKAIIIAGNGSYTGRTSFYNGGFDLYQRTYACTIREQDKENLMIFFYHMMKQFFEPTKMGGTRGSSIPYIVMGDITQQKFPYSKDWLIRFSNIANSMMDRKLRIDKENSRLSTLRDTLLPRLMSGEIELPE